MPLLGFKRRFAPMVLDGSKQHTIRAKRKIPVKPGDICHCYVDPRQKTMTLLGRWPCTAVQEITILATDHPPIPLVVSIDGEVLAVDEANDLFRRDGFRDEGGETYTHIHQAAEFWKDILAKGSLESQLIHWKYDYPGERR